MVLILTVVVLVCVAGCVALGFLYVKSQEKLARFNAIDDVEVHMRECQSQASQAQSQYQSLVAEQGQVKSTNDELRKKQAALQRVVGSFQSLADVQTETTRAQQQLDALAHALQCGNTAQEFAAQEQYYRNLLAEVQKQVAEAEDCLVMQEFGFYQPKYDLATSADYKTALDDVKERQKAMMRDDTAWVCTTEWHVDGSREAGVKKTKEFAKLMLRGFNGESDVAIAKVKYNNAVNMEKRIKRAFDQINKLGTTNATTIVEPYRDLKLMELHLAHELAVKKQEEREEAARIREEMREQEKAEKEIKSAQAAAEKEEAAKEKALAQARKELAAAEGANTLKMQELIAKLENELKEAIDRKAKAIARAQLTRSGHVYILSNIGVFGEGVFKIGLTRRLDPLERVKELGSASVPFLFDVHAIIYSEDAPALEKALHDYFADRRVNMINQRKEFFRVSLDEIRAAVAELHGNVTFVLEPEAEEYRQTLALLRDQQSVPMVSA